jgi:hypothetical protein
MYNRQYNNARYNNARYNNARLSIKIKINLQKVGLEVWTDLVQHRDRRRAPANVVMNLGVQYS